MSRFVLISLAVYFSPSASLVLRGNQSAGRLLHFDEFRATYGRNYGPGSSEYEMRKGIYERRLEEIRAHNAKPGRIWTAGINHLADETNEEFNKRLGWRHEPGSRRPAKAGHALLEGAGKSLPKSVSWTHLKLGSEVDDQGGCGSCWAMATVATLNAHYEIKYGKQTKFSPQELIDCVQNPLSCGGQGGCEGATVELAMDWAVYNGLAPLHETKYHQTVGTCKKGLFRATAEEQGKLDEDGRLIEMFKPSVMSLVAAGDKNSIGLSSYTTLPSNKLEPLLKAVTSGPVAISVAASKWSIYTSGIFDECGREFDTINHAVVLFGYGFQGSLQYWLVRNSWGSNWGENGYIRLIRSDDEESHCATDDQPKQGVSCTGAPRSVKVCGHCGILYDSVVPNLEGGGVHVKPKIDGPSDETEPDVFLKDK